MLESSLVFFPPDSFRASRLIIEVSAAAKRSLLVCQLSSLSGVTVTICGEASKLVVFLCFSAPVGFFGEVLNLPSSKDASIRNIFSRFFYRSILVETHSFGS